MEISGGNKIALFEKKNCSVCGRKIGLLGGRKLSDGNLCKDCAKKLSPWFSDYKSTPTESIRAQLADREENRKRLSVFKTTKCFGEFGSILIDEDARVFAAIEDSAASLFGERKEITDIAEIIDRNPDVVRFDQVADVDIDVVQTQHEEKQTVNGQQVSYNPKHITYMYMFYAVIRLNHPYIPSMRVQLNNSAVQIPNEGERLRNKVGLRLAEYLLDLPIRDVTKTEKIYDNNSLKDILTRSPYAMPDYSYGFKCSLPNREGIERYLEEHGQNAYIKPADHEIRKTRKYRKDVYRVENMPYDPETDSYTCPNGKKLNHMYDRRPKSDNGFRSTKQTYVCESCAGCPHREKCFKGKYENRAISVSQTFNRQKREAEEQISTPEGILLRVNRSIQVEGAFGVIKEDYAFRRFLTRGKTKTETQFFLIAFAFNIRKLCARIESGRFGKALFEPDAA